MERFRNWLAVIYPESLPLDWLSRLESFQVPLAVSPLHDKDVSDAGVLKKAHYHVIFAFSGKKSLSQVKVFTDSLSAPPPVPCRDLRASARYLAHMDSPDKARYSVEDCRAFGGFPLARYLIGGGNAPVASFDTLAEIMRFCRQTGVLEYSSLVDYCISQREEWFPSVIRFHAALNTYLRSARFRESTQLESESLESGRAGFEKSVYSLLPENRVRDVSDAEMARLWSARKSLGREAFMEILDSVKAAVCLSADSSEPPVDFPDILQSDFSLRLAQAVRQVSVQETLDMPL